MNTFRVSFAGAAALLSAAVACAQAAPRTFNSYYFFGDSLTDSGNTFALTGQPPAPYFQGRFSNGITYAEYLVPGLRAHATAAPTVRTNLNFAFAGATAAPGSAVPSLAQQVALFQSRAITPTANDLFVVLAGANDLLNTVANPATQNGQSMVNSGVGASTAVAGAVQSLAALGARNIFVLNLPDISRTARFVTGSGAPAASLAQQGSFAFNNDLPGRLAALNLPAGTNVTVFDLGAVFNGLLNNAAALGFTNTTQEYLGLLMAGANPGNVSNYVFWDGIHPTTRAHQVFANALAEALNPEFVLGSSGAIGTAALTAADMSADAIASRLDLLEAIAERGTHAYLMYNYKDGSRDWSGYQGEFDYNGNVITGGFDLRIGASLIGGLALSKESVAVDFKAGAGSFKLSGESIAAYAQWRGGAMFADAVVHYGAHDVRSIGRTTSLGLMTAGETDGERWGAAVRLGGNFGAENYSITPFVGLRYTRAKLDGYAESGVSGLNFSYEGQTAKTVDGLIGVTATWRMPIEMPVHLGVSAVYQTDLADDVRELSGRLGNTVAATSRVGVTDGLEESIKLGLRAHGEISKRWGWTAGYMAEIRDDGDTASQYSIGVQTGF